MLKNICMYIIFFHLQLNTLFDCSHDQKPNNVNETAQHLKPLVRTKTSYTACLSKYNKKLSNKY